MNRLLLVAGLLLSAAGCAKPTPCVVKTVGGCHRMGGCGVMCEDGRYCRDVYQPVVGLTVYVHACEVSK